VVLSRADSGDADLVVTFLTRELGLISALAKNAKKSVRRFGGGLLAPGAAAFYDFRIRERRDLALVERGEPNPRAPTLPPDPPVQALAAWALELVRAFEAPRNPAGPSFNLLLKYLGALAPLRGEPPPFMEGRSLSLAFTKLYMELSGFGPNLKSCRSCGRPPESKGHYHLERLDPRILCPACQEQSDDPGHYGFPGTLVIKLLNINDLKGKPQFTPDELKLAEDFYVGLASGSSGRLFKSRRVLLSYLREAPGPEGPGE
jgi:DNA repair protein RecO (recombination protein O)